MPRKLHNLCRLAGASMVAANSELCDNRDKARDEVRRLMPIILRELDGFTETDIRALEWAIFLKKGTVSNG